MKIRVHEPTNGPIPTCGLLYFHGGAGIAGDIYSNSGMIEHYAHESECAIFSVDYRLAPENRSPTGIVDAYASVKWLVD